MTRLFYYGTIILTVVGLGISLLIFPGDDEVAFLQYKDKWYSKALVLYELQVEKGNLSAQVVSPLTDLYLKYGYIDKAILLMETFVSRNPRHVDALKKLGLYYQYAQRYDDYTRTLELIYQIRTEPDILRKLSAIHNFNGNLDRQLTVLEELTTQFQASKQDHLDLAYLYAARQQYDAAVLTLERYAKRSGTTDPAMVELMINLLIDASQPEKAFTIASEYSQRGNEGDVLRYANRLHARNQHELAYQLLEPYQSQVTKRPAMLQTLVSLEIARGHKTLAFNRLAVLFDNNQLPVQQLELLADLVIERNELPLMKRIARTAPLDWINRDQLWVMINRFEQDNDIDSLQVMHSRLNPDLRSEYPVIDIKLKIATRAKGSAAAAKSARSRPWLKDEQRIQLARIYQQGNLLRLASDILSDIRSLEKTENLDPYDMAILYISLDMADKGLRLFDMEFRRMGQSDSERQKQFELSAVHLALAAGKEARVMAYLNRPGKPDIQQLTDLYYLAASKQKTRIMLETSRQLMLVESRKDEDRFLGFRVDALLAAKRDKEALPLLRKLARKNYSDWIYVYADVLEKRQLNTEWVALWVRQSNRKDLGRAEKRSIGFALREKKYRAKANTIFLELAKNRNPDDPDVNQLVSLWELDKKPEGLAWLTERIDQSDPLNQRKWFAMYYALAVAVNQPQQIESGVSRHPQLFDEWTSLDIQNGREKIAYRRLGEKHQQGRLSAGSLASLIKLAVDLGDKTMVRKLVLETDLDQINADSRIRLFSLLLMSFTQKETGKLRNELDAHFFDRNPLIRLMFEAAENRALNELAVSDLVDKMEINPQQRLILGEFFIRLCCKKSHKGVKITKQ